MRTTTGLFGPAASSGASAEMSERVVSCQCTIQQEAIYLFGPGSRSVSAQTRTAEARQQLFRYWVKGGGSESYELVKS